MLTSRNRDRHLNWIVTAMTVMPVMAVGCGDSTASSGTDTDGSESDSDSESDTDNR
jgi:hypothetical protein